MKHLLYFGTLGLALAGCQATAPTTATPPRQVKTLGYGSVTAYPDYADLTVDASFTRPRLRDAVTEVQQVVDEVLALSKRFAPGPDDVRISSTSSNKEFAYPNGKQQFVGFQATQSVTVRISDLRQLSPYLEQLLATRVSRISSLSYGHSRADSLHREANARALADALRTADKMCATLHVKRGPVLEISDEGGHRRGGPDGWGSSGEDIELYGKGFGGRGFRVTPELLHFNSTCALTAGLE